MGRRRGLRLTVVFATLVAGLIATASAGAVVQSVKITEVYPGSASNPGAEYMELQIYDPLPSDLNTGDLDNMRVELWGSGGQPGAAASTPAAFTVAPQRTILWGASAAEDEFNVQFDTTNWGTVLENDGGWACVMMDLQTADYPLDCVAWGTGITTPPFGPTGTPAPAIPDGQSLHRSIAPGCPTRLEFADDTNDSATDFFLGAPSPRPNDVAPTETSCPPPATAPGTKITKGPKRRTDERRAKFKFEASLPGATFECKLDRRRFKPCSSPFRKRVDRGKHVFKVRASAGGLTDTSPAKRKWRVLPS
ncbi:MAG TPA: hypothetical protein VHF58_08935 [Solirubrobacterales bacterium]|nr:hypothetical protein [Solirubrobacterales bacterium]